MAHYKGKRDIWYHFDRAIDIADRGLGTATKHAGPLGALAALINIEKKFFDNYNFGYAWTTGATGAIPLTSNIPQGDGESQCIGNSIKLLSAYFKYRIKVNVTENSSQSIRVIVVADRDASGAAPAITDILQQGVTTSAAWMISPLNKTTSFHSGQETRFLILLDTVHKLADSIDDEQYHEHYWDQHHKLGDDHHALWSGDSHSDSTVLGGHIYAFMLYTQMTATSTAPTYAYNTTNPPGMAFYSRVRYTDD